LKPISYHFEAKREADAAAAFYYDDDPAVASSFLTVLERIVEEIQTAPQRWPYEGKTSVQRRQLKRFPFTIFYVNEPERVFVLAVAHTSRRPGYWTARVRT
jgi:toxin ParE1/3/4